MEDTLARNLAQGRLFVQDQSHARICWLPGEAMRYCISMNRRQFIETSALGISAAALTPFGRAAEENRKGVNWPIGSFNRPWAAEKNKWGGFDVALDGIKEAGYKIIGLLSRSAKEPLLGSDAT